jgi:hypothetical protein
MAELYFDVSRKFNLHLRIAKDLRGCLASETRD